MFFSRKSLTFVDIFVFWAPLSATWLIMTVEAPFLAAIIARLTNPKYNLAAYGVAYSLALFFESPIVMIMSASNALVKNGNSFTRMRNFTYIVNAIITILLLLIVTPPIFRFIAEKLIGLPGDVSRIAQSASLILLPWPAAIGYRRFYQGVLIRNNLPRKVIYGGMIRLTSMALTALILSRFFEIKGAYVGAAALSAGVLMEAIASKFMARKTSERLLHNSSSSLAQGQLLSYMQIAKFYLPLAFTSILTVGILPLVTFFMGRSRLAIESLALLPVISSLILIFRSFGFSFQEVSIALLSEYQQNFRRLGTSALFLGILTSGGLSIIAFTSLSRIWFHNISGLSSELTYLAITPTRIMSIIPFLTVLTSFLRSNLICARSTKPIRNATVLELLVIVALLIIGIHYYGMVGILAASVALSVGSFCSTSYLSTQSFNIL
jgi:hypothetical protein